MTDPAEQVRAMLRARADDVQHVPSRLIDLTPRPAATTQRRPAAHRRVLVAASVSVVLVVGLALGLAARPSHDDPSAPATTRARQSTGTTTSLPSAPRTCPHVDKTDLGHAISAGYHNPYPHANRLVAVAPDGTAYDARYGSMEIVRINRDGTTTRVLGPLNGLGGGPTGASVDDRYLAFGVPLTQGGGGQRPTSIYVVTAASGAVHQIRTATAGDSTIVLGPALRDGHVYWTEIGAGNDASTGQVRDYDIATAVTRTVATGATSSPVVAGGGLYWAAGQRLVTYRPGSLPRGFAPRPDKDYGSFVADASSAAWLRYVGAQAQVVLQQGTRAPRVLATGDELDGGGVDAVSGPFTSWHDASGREVVFDARTDVVATDVLNGLVNAPPVAAHGLLILPAANGGFAVVRAAVVAPLRC